MFANETDLHRLRSILQRYFSHKYDYEITFDFTWFTHFHLTTPLLMAKVITLSGIDIVGGQSLIEYWSPSYKSINRFSIAGRVS